LTQAAGATILQHPLLKKTAAPGCTTTPEAGGHATGQEVEVVLAAEGERTKEYRWRCPSPCLAFPIALPQHVTPKQASPQGTFSEQ
jgi:hypothetical protein